MYEIIIGRKGDDRKRLGLRGAVFIGKQYVKMGQTTSLSNKVYMDLTRSHVVFVVGKRGFGKSYAISAIAEGIMDKSMIEPEIAQNLSMIMLDTMGIFWTMKYPNPKDKELLNEWELKPEGMDVQIFTPIGKYEQYKEQGVPTDFAFAIQPNELDAEDWCLTFDININSELGVLIQTIITELRDEGSNYPIDEIIGRVRTKNAEPHVKEGVENRFTNVKKWGLFDTKGTKLKDLVIGGKVSVLDVSAYATEPNGWAIKNLVIGLVAKKLFIERMKARREEEFEDVKSKTEFFKSGEAKEKKKDPLVWLILDEGHEFLKREGKTTASQPLITILREGRQPGISLILATQQPGKIHTDVMTQADIVLSLRLTAKMDLDSLKQLSQSYLRESLETNINQLPRVPGAAVVLDDANERIYPIQVRPKITWHGGEAPTALPEKKDVMGF